MLDRSFGTTQGNILNRGASIWTATPTLSLGLNGTAGGSVTLQGFTSGSVAITVPAAAGTATLFQLPSSNGTSGFVLNTDGAGHLSWASSGSGTVTSVGLSLPGIFTVAGSPVTNTGTLTGTLNTQNANLIWAGPTTGAAATPTFRSLVGADLPNPSATTLGGVESIAAVTSNWIRSISTSGVPAASQPAFADISGTLAPTQCPNPSATTLGCVESYVAVSHQWINSISTLGVPASTQPTFGDVSGNASLGQLPNIGNNTIISNIAGSTATPLANSLSAIIDASIASTQGDVLYRGSTGWSALGPGTGGQVLTTGGAAANPSWTSVSGTGTVTSIATNNGITGGAITTSGTIGLAPIATGNVLANVSGISAAPTATIPSSVLDVIGSTEGDVLFRGASTWLPLTPGTNGQFLQTLGPSSTPQWASAVTSLNGQIGAISLIHALYASNFGVVCDGTTVNTSTYVSAMNAFPASGGTLLMPPGICIGVMAVNKPVIVQGTGMGNPTNSPITGNCGTEIRSTGASDNIVTFSANGGGLRDVCVTSSVAASSRTGAGVKIGSVQGIEIRNVVSYGHLHNFWNTAPGNTFIQAYGFGASGCGLFLDGSSFSQSEINVVDSQFNSNLNGECLGGAGVGVFHKRVTLASNTDYGRVYNSGATYNDVYDLQPEISSNGVHGINAINNTGTNLGISGDGVVEVVSGSGNAIVTGTGQTGVNISGTYLSGGAGVPAFSIAGNHTVLTGNQILGTPGGGYAGNFAATASDFNVSANTFLQSSGSGNGLLINAGSNAGIVTSNNFEGFTNPVTNNSTAANVLVSNNCGAAGCQSWLSGATGSITTGTAFSALFTGVVAVSFTRAFASTPTVSLSPVNGGPSGAVGCYAESISTTGFTARGIGLTNGGAFTCDYIASVTAF